APFAAFRRAVHAGDERLGREELLLLDEIGDLRDLAAEPDENEARDVGVAREAREHAIEALVILAAILHAAAGLVRDRQDAVDVREFGEDLARKALGDESARRC